MGSYQKRDSTSELKPTVGLKAIAELKLTVEFKSMGG
jgi:hypothetical protein